MNAALDFRMARIVISAVQDVYEGYSASFPLVEQVLTQPILPGWLLTNIIDLANEVFPLHSYGRKLGRR
jgi:hypothetical protein